MSANGAADIGLAVMGQNPALNITDHGRVEAVFNCPVAKVDGFLAGPAKDTRIIGAHAIEELVSVLKRLRRVMPMVKAIAAQVPEGDPHGTPCCGWVGEKEPVTWSRWCTTRIPNSATFCWRLTSPKLPANLIQAQRDYFGAHTYERVDRPRGQFFHTDRAGHGGDVAAGASLT